MSKGVSILQMNCDSLWMYGMVTDAVDVVNRIHFFKLMLDVV